MSNQSAPGFLAGRSGFVLAGAVLIFALLVAAAWWVLRPSYVALHKEANEASQAEILATLSQKGVPYRINAQEGIIEVPTEHAAAARMYLAESGIPTRSGVGFELFDQADYGMSEFSQKINYQRALEGELARTVMSMSEVQYARVHLTFRKAALFQKVEEASKASVIVRLRDGSDLGAQRVRGIQQLVASAVEGMVPEHVAVIDEGGQVLSSSGNAVAVPEHLQMAAQVERTLKDKVEQLLLPSLGQGAAQVSVRVMMNFDRVRSVREQPLLPAGKPVVRHEKRLVSNESSSGDASSKRSQNTQETDYEFGKEHAEIEHAAGKVEKVNVGIVLAEPMGAEEIAGLHDLLNASLGLDEARGDQLVITYLKPRAQIAPSTPAPVQERLASPVAADLPSVTSPGGDTNGLRYGLAAGAAALSLLFLLLWWRGRSRRVQPVAVMPRMSSVEREQLLIDLKRWLVEER